MKPRPRFVDHGLVDAKWTQALRLLLVPGGFAKIARVTMKHPRHMIGNFATGAECNRFLAGLNGLVVAAQKCRGVSPDRVSLAALRIRQQGTICAIESSSVGSGRIGDPPKSRLIDQREPKEHE